MIWLRTRRPVDCRCGVDTCIFVCVRTELVGYLIISGGKLTYVEQIVKLQLICKLRLAESILAYCT